MGRRIKEQRKKVLKERDLEAQMVQSLLSLFGPD